MDRTTFRILEPHIAALPGRTRVNVNTATYAVLQSLDENIVSVLRDKYGDRMQRMLSNSVDMGAYEELFTFACPKFISPAPPPYDASQLRLGDDFAARVLPGDRKSVWLDTAAPPRAAPPPPRAPPSQTDPRTWTKAVDPASGYAYRYDANGNSVWEHELAQAPPAAAQPIPPQNRGMSKRAARYSESSASESSDDSSDSSDDDCCECFRSRPAYKKLSTT